MGLRLRWRSATRLPVEADGLLPDALAGRPAAEVSRLRLSVGNATAEVGELFDVTEEKGIDPLITLSGDLSPLRGLGRGMRAGAIVLEGTAGPYLGLGMAGGVIEVQGSAGDWAGAEMAGGTIRILGDAGLGLGSALPGSRLGMREGVILVNGSAGEEAGHKMRRGLIAVAGALGPFAGRAMIAGTIVAFGPVGPHPGMAMKRGTIVLVGRESPRLLPTFAPTGSYRFPFLALYFKELARAGLPVPARVFSSEFRRYNGDLAEGGHGEILAETFTDQGVTG
ncbi:MAG: formylmethanofuran dehydrogenase subunit C [Isosphaeraceae bacterium]